MKKLFKPGNTVPPVGKPNWINPKKPKDGIKYLPVILIIGILFVSIVLLSNLPSNPVKDKQRNTKERIYKNNNAPVILPEGTAGEWAKALVFIQAGIIQGGQFFPEMSGSGFLVAENQIITNAHVVPDGKDLVVTYYDGTYAVAAKNKESRNIDLALLEVPIKKGLAPVSLHRDDDVRIGRKVIVMGFPLGETLGRELTMTEGIISSIRRDDDGFLIWYQISAPVNPGNSGGPLFDAATGEVLGVVTSKISEAENIGFARPGSIVTEWLK